MMTVHQLNEEMVNEMSLQTVKDGAKKIKDGVVDATKKAVQVIKDEASDNKMAFGIFKKKIMSKFGKGEAPTPEEFKKAVEQMLKDNPKLLLIGGIAAAPGSAVTLPIAMKVAKKFGIELAPKKTF
jgi:hypothetical protein